MWVFHSLNPCTEFHQILRICLPQEDLLQLHCYLLSAKAEVGRLWNTFRACVCVCVHVSIFHTFTSIIFERPSQQSLHSSYSSKVRSTNKMLWHHILYAGRKSCTPPIKWWQSCQWRHRMSFLDIWRGWSALTI